MFTGIVEEVGKIGASRRVDGGVRLDITADKVLQGTDPGDSIAVDGVCLTVESLTLSSFSCFVSLETLEVTTLDGLSGGRDVNLERALAVGDRVGGHLMPGHVEAVGTVKSIHSSGDGHRFDISFPDDFAKYVVKKGSVAIDGISLTVSGHSGMSFSVAIVPKTLENTTLRLKRSGDSVNLEPDLVLKYVRSSMLSLAQDEESGDITMEKLIKSGFISD